MKEELISFKTAVLAKEKGLTGFKSHSWYYKDGTLHKTTGCQDWNTWDYTQGVRWTVITQSLLQKWLREKHEIYIYVLPQGTSDKKIIWGNNSSMRENIYFPTYEEAMEAGLINGLNLIK